MGVPFSMTAAVSCVTMAFPYGSIPLAFGAAVIVWEVLKILQVTPSVTNDNETNVNALHASFVTVVTALL